MTEDLELYVKELKDKFEDLEKIVFNDEEELNNKEFSAFAEEMLELNHMMIEKIREMDYRLGLLERVAKIPDLQEQVKVYTESQKDTPDFFS